MQQTIRGTLVECGVLDVLAEDAGAFLVAASKQVAALVKVMHGLGCLIMLVRHRFSLQIDASAMTNLRTHQSALSETIQQGGRWRNYRHTVAIFEAVETGSECFREPLSSPCA